MIKGQAFLFLACFGLLTFVWQSVLVISNDDLEHLMDALYYHSELLHFLRTVTLSTCTLKQFASIDKFWKRFKQFFHLLCLQIPLILFLFKGQVLPFNLLSLVLNLFFLKVHLLGRLFQLLLALFYFFFFIRDLLVLVFQLFKHPGDVIVLGFYPTVFLFEDHSNLLYFLRNSDSSQLGLILRGGIHVFCHLRIE